MFVMNGNTLHPRFVDAGLPEGGFEVPHARGVGAAAGHEGVARGPAHGLLHIGVVEGHRLGRELLDVRRLGESGLLE